MKSYTSHIRSFVGNETLLLPTTTCFISNEKGEILLQERADNGDWSCPGGIMELGEHVFEAMQREVKEETNIDIHEANLLGVYSNSFVTYSNGDRASFVNNAFVATKYDGDMRINDNESLDLKFFSLEDLPKITEDQKRIFEDYKKYVKGEVKIPVIR